MIVKKAAATNSTPLVGKGTDLIVLLSYHASPITSSFILG